jgi:hypothetical protein
VGDFKASPIVFHGITQYAINKKTITPPVSQGQYFEIIPVKVVSSGPEVQRTRQIKPLETRIMAYLVFGFQCESTGDL